jgi:hypothetical protein
MIWATIITYYNMGTITAYSITVTIKDYYDTATMTAYYITVTLTAIKIFIIHATWACTMTLFTAVI